MTELQFRMRVAEVLNDLYARRDNASLYLPEWPDAEYMSGRYEAFNEAIRLLTDLGVERPAKSAF